MSWPRLEVVKVVTVFDTNGNRGKEWERLGKITERKRFRKSIPDIILLLERRVSRRTVIWPNRNIRLDREGSKVNATNLFVTFTFPLGESSTRFGSIFESSRSTGESLVELG